MRVRSEDRDPERILGIDQHQGASKVAAWGSFDRFAARQDHTHQGCHTDRAKLGAKPVMSMTTKIIAEPNHLLVQVSGEFSLEEAKLSFLDLVNAVKRHGLGNVLYDGRALAGEPRLMERFYYGHFVADTIQDLKDRGWKGPELRFAYVLKEPVLHEQRLGEATAASRGMNVRVFENINEAVVWLLPNIPSSGPNLNSRKVQYLKPEE